MAKPIKYTATAPDGTVATRNSHRTYSHAVMVETPKGWDAYSWAGRVDLAHNKTSECARAWKGCQIVVVAVEIEGAK